MQITYTGTTLRRSAQIIYTWTTLRRSAQTTYTGTTLRRSAQITYTGTTLRRSAQITYTGTTPENGSRITTRGQIQRLSSRQLAKHAKLYSDLLQPLQHNLFQLTRYSLCLEPVLTDLLPVATAPHGMLGESVSKWRLTSRPTGCWERQ